MVTKDKQIFKIVLDFWIFENWAQQYKTTITTYHFGFCPILITRYKSLLFLLRKQFYVLWLYFNKGCCGVDLFFKMGAVISQYLFHIGLHIGLRQLSYFSTTSMKELFALQFKDQPKMLWIKLAPSNFGGVCR